MRGFIRNNIGTANGIKNSTHQAGFKQAVRVGTVDTATYPEISGFTRPTRPENVGKNYMWAHQDSGQSSKFIVINTSTAAVQGAWTLGSLSATQNAPTDFEDCTSARINNISYLYIGDMGNNTGAAANSRNATVAGADLIVYRMREPVITGVDGTIPDADIETIGCAYPGTDGPPDVAGGRDAETMFPDPDTGDIYIVTKRNFPALIYKLPHATSYSGLQTLTYVGKLANYPSVTSNTIGTGSFTFAVTGLSFPVGMRIRAQNSTSNYMEGVVTAMSDGSVTMYVEVNTPTMSELQFAGSGTFTSWNLTLPTSFTPTLNNGCTTGGCTDPAGTSVVICSYLTNYLFTRNKSEPFASGLVRAPIIMTAVQGSSGMRHDNFPTMMPQRESIEFADPAGTYLYSMSEYQSTRGATGTNALVRYDRVPRKTYTVRLQQGLDGYSGCTDTYINATSPSLNGSLSGSLICDVDVATAAAFTSGFSVSGGTHTHFSTTALAAAVTGGKTSLTGCSYTGYNGTWKVTNKVSTTGITLKVPYVSSSSGTMVVHTNDREALVKYNLSGYVPSGATITDATFRMFVNTEGLTYSLHKMNKAWTTGDTFNSLSGSIMTRDDSDASFQPECVVSGMFSYVLFQDMPVRPSTVQGWVDDPSSNYGLTVQHWRNSLETNGFQIDSSESTTQTRKPMLTVSYYV